MAARIVVPFSLCGPAREPRTGNLQKRSRECSPECSQESGFSQECSRECSEQQEEHCSLKSTPGSTPESTPICESTSPGRSCDTAVKTNWRSSFSSGEAHQIAFHSLDMALRISSGSLLSSADAHCRASLWRDTASHSEQQKFPSGGSSKALFQKLFSEHFLV